MMAKQAGNCNIISCFTVDFDDFCNFNCVTSFGGFGPCQGIENLSDCSVHQLSIISVRNSRKFAVVVDVARIADGAYPQIQS